MKNKKGLFTAFGLFLMTMLTLAIVGGHYVINWFSHLAH